MATQSDLKSASAALDASDAALKEPDTDPDGEFEDVITAVTEMTDEMRAVVAEARKTQPSIGDIHVHVETAKPPSIPPHLALLGKYGKPVGVAIAAVTGVVALAEEIWQLVHGK